MESKFRLKDRFISLFRRPALLVSANCGGRLSTTPAGKQKKNKKKEIIRDRENSKLYNHEGRNCPPTSPSSPSKNKTTTKKKKMMMMTTNRSKRRQLFSSSDFYKKAKKVKSLSKLRRRENKSRCLLLDDGFQPLVSMSRRRVEEEEEEGGFAVMKNSSDPYGDFQRSMVEMIVERQIFGVGELRLLLRSYLSLNSVQNHPVILEAFVDVWQVLFG